MKPEVITQAGGNVPVRKLNMELMRIVAMMLVLLVHATFLPNPWPVRRMFEDDFVNTFIFSYVEALALVCVNCFILISGYFSIRPKLKSLCNLLFLIYFYKLLFFGLDTAINGFSQENMWKTLYPFSDWFVGAYLGLYLLSPVINKFTDTSGEREFRYFLVTYMAVMLTMGWLMPLTDVNIESINDTPFMQFSNGYSVFSFIGLYCLARYIRLHGSQTIDALTAHLKARHFLLIYMLLALVNTVLFAAARLYGGDSDYYLSHLFEKYTNPFTVAGAVCLLLFFTKIRISNASASASAIIVFGKSAFAIYLIHFNFFTLPYYKQAAHAIFEALPIWGWIPAIILFVIIVYTLCVLIDQIRIACWQWVSNRK